MHLGMLWLSQEMFQTTDYDKKLLRLLEYYPLLMRSYSEKAIENYVRPLILNYHNHYSKMEEVEEVFYERTGRVVYKIKPSDSHFIWPSSQAEMVKDWMFYEFD